MVLLSFLLAACSGAGEDLPEIDATAIAPTREILSSHADELAAVQEAVEVAIGAGAAEVRCASALESLTPVTADELMEIAAAIPDEVLHEAYLAQRATLLRLMRSCDQGSPLAQEDVDRLAWIQETIAARTAALEAAG